MSGAQLVIREFEENDQTVAADVISIGLGERWGHIDRSKNPDLFDITNSFSAGCFLIGEIAGQVVATGAYMPEVGEIATVRMQRMSVLKSHRGLGYGKQMLTALEKRAFSKGFATSVLETTETWFDAIAFYHSQGYTTSGLSGGDIHMFKSLDPHGSE